MARGAKGLEASDAVRAEWLRRIEAEYTSCAVTQNLTLWLTQIAASPDLVRAGLRISGDELVHARLSHKAYLAAGGQGAPHLVRDHLGLRRHDGEPLEFDVTRVAVTTFCLGETVAVPLFKTLRENCVVPPARRVLDRVLRDEVRHRDFGWALLTWLLEQSMAAQLRALASRELPRAFGALRLSYGASIRHMTHIPEADKKWGLMPPADYAAIVERTLTRDWIPRFGALGIDAQRAWDAAALPKAAVP
jgi:hypothetical protein